MGPFCPAGTSCPDGGCRSVDTASVCCCRKNLEEMCENEGQQQSLVYESGLFACIDTSVSAEGVMWSFKFWLCVNSVSAFICGHYQLMMCDKNVYNLYTGKDTKRVFV